MTRFVVTTHYGGDDAAEAVEDLVKQAKKSLKALDEGNYSRDIDRFVFYLGISGEISTFKEQSGCWNLRLMKKDRYIKIYLIVQQEVWRRGKKAAKRFLKENILIAVEQMVDRIKKAKLHIERDRLLEDLRKTLDTDLA